MINKIKIYSTNLTTMDAKLFKQIKMLATKLNKDQNDLLEEAAKNPIKKYEHKGILAAPESLSKCQP